MSKKLRQAARIVVDDCLGIKRHEKVLIVIDEPCRTIGQVLWDTLLDRTDPLLIEIKPRTIHGEEPPEMVADILTQCDVFIMPTSKSLSHTQARIRASKSGARGATMPGITVAVMERALNADYREISRRTFRATKMLSKARRAIIESNNGSHLELDLSSRPGHIDTGIIKRKSEFSNLPAGEAYIAPRENKSNGVIVIDGSFAPVGFIDKPIIVEVRKGRIINISGNPKMKTIFNTYGPKERTLCEFGIGTNPKAKITGNVLEDEKVCGSIHVAFGNNLAFGGVNNAKIHLDGIVKKPTVWLDKKLVIKNGTFLL